MRKEEHWMRHRLGRKGEVNNEQPQEELGYQGSAAHCNRLIPSSLKSLGLSVCLEWGELELVL